MSAARTEPLARQALAFVLAGGRGSRLMELTDRRAKPAVYFGGKSPHHRFRAVERAEFRHPPHRGRHPVQGAQPDPPSAARLELLPPRAQRELRHPAGEPARLGDQWYVGTADAVYQNIDIIESYGAELHRRAGRRPRLQDGLRADAAAARRAAAPTSRSAASRCRAWRRPASASCMSTRTDRIIAFLEKPTDPPPHAGQAGHGARQHGHLRLRHEVPVRPAAARRRRSELEPRFRQGHHSLPRQERQGGRASLRRAPACAPSDEAEAYWRDVGTVDAYWEANIDLTDVVPGARSLRPRLADLDLCARSRRRPSSSTTRTAGAAGGRARWSRAAASSPAPRLRRSLLFTGVHVHSYARLENAVMLPYVDVGRGARLRKVVIDRGVEHSRGPRRRRGSRARRQALPPHRAAASASSPSR